MKRISFKGIILALLLTLALDTIAGVTMFVSMGGSFLRRGMNQQQMSDAIATVTLSTDFLLGSILFGTLATIVGGYVAARIAKKEPYLNAGMIGALGFVLGVLTANYNPLWFNVVGLGLVLPAALLGGHLARSRIERSA